MYKFLLALMMLLVVGCASKSIAVTTPLDVGDGAPLEEVAAVDDEAVEDLPDMVASEN
jgi:hypothetical protein